MSHHEDMKHELRRTGSVGASIDTMRNTFVNRLRAGLDADNGRGDMPALRALLADMEDGDGIRAAILHGTSAGKEGGDVDPNDPVPASNPGSLGGNVYGSQGPADNPRQNSMGASARGAEDLPENRIANTTQAGFGAHAHGIGDPAHAEGVYDPGQSGAPLADRMETAPGAEKYKQGVGKDTDTRGTFNAAEQAEHDREHPDAGKGDPATAAGGTQQTGQQKVNPTGEDKRADTASFDEHDREPA